MSSINLDKLFALIKYFEGFRPKPYLCPAGIPTIGYGSTRYSDGRRVTLRESPISEPEAFGMMQRYAELCAYTAFKSSPILHNYPDRLCAIADFIYNLGVTRYNSSTLKKRVDAEDWQGAQEEIVKWVYGGGKKLPGLIARRESERKLLE